MRSISMQSSRSAMIAFGSSLSGRWGDPTQEIVQSIQRLAETGIVLLALSSCYRTCPLGGGRQARYWNAVGLFASAYPPYQLLRILKRIEGEAGRRRLMRRWGPRVLDLDLIDSGARVIGWARRTAGRQLLVLPHPEAHRRGFVLRPLLDVAPHWWHPARGVPARRLWQRLHRTRGDVVRLPDNAPFGGRRDGVASAGESLESD